ncbi:MAG TPA: flagellar basal body P-ring protein FlgI [Casimicrobiaceae bacterium]
MNMHSILRPACARVICALVLALACAGAASAERIKDVASIRGVRNNQLIGYGLVVGLDGTGDQTTQTPFTVQSIGSMLSQLGINVPSGQNLQLKNVAAVMVTAELAAFAQPGQQFDITVSSLGNAKSLRGGTLLMTPLKGADGQVYAMAQGNVAIAGAGASAGGSKTQVNQLNAGRIPNGATVERGVPNPLAQQAYIDLELHDTDFGMARQVANAVNRRFGPTTATALDGRTIQVSPGTADRVGFVAELQSLAVGESMPAAKVIINARTGSIVMNEAVTLEACAVAHGNLTVTIQSNPQVSQPGPFSSGQTVVTDRTTIDLKQDGNGFLPVAAGARLADVVRALNTLGATPQDLLAILQAMKAAGALRAEIEVI